MKSGLGLAGPAIEQALKCGRASAPGKQERDEQKWRWHAKARTPLWAQSLTVGSGGIQPFIAQRGEGWDARTRRRCEQIQESKCPRNMTNVTRHPWGHAYKHDARSLPSGSYSRRNRHRRCCRHPPHAAVPTTVERRTPPPARPPPKTHVSDQRHRKAGATAAAMKRRRWRHGRATMRRPSHRPSAGAG